MPRHNFGALPPEVISVVTASHNQHLMLQVRGSRGLDASRYRHLDVSTPDIPRSSVHVGERGLPIRIRTCVQELRGEEERTGIMHVNLVSDLSKT